MAEVIKKEKETAKKPAEKRVNEQKAAAGTAIEKVEINSISSAEKSINTAAVKKSAVKKTSLTRAKKTEGKRNSRKVLQGVVISNKMDKTGVIAITRKVPHPLYKKVVTKTTKLKFHDEKNECDIGDRIEIMETRHFSKDKYFRLIRIVEKVK